MNETVADQKILHMLRGSEAFVEPIPIMETFFGFQGEGIRTGRLSEFIRVAGCTRSCKWCDTAGSQSADAANYVERLSELFELIGVTHEKERILCGCGEVVITGGEPMLYWDSPYGLGELVYWLSCLYNLRVTIETNGDIIPKDTRLFYDPEVLYSVSPKPPSSGASFTNWSGLEGVLLFVAHGARAKCHVQLKFVVQDEKDLVWVVDGLRKQLRLRNGSYVARKTSIILQPAASDLTSPLAIEMYRKQVDKIYSFVREGHFRGLPDVRVMIQQHAIIYGRRSGV